MEIHCTASAKDEERAGKVYIELHAVNQVPVWQCKVSENGTEIIVRYNLGLSDTTRNVFQGTELKSRLVQAYITPVRGVLSWIRFWGCVREKLKPNPGEYRFCTHDNRCQVF